jgi:hypothetical protein
MFVVPLESVGRLSDSAGELATVAFKELKSELYTRMSNEH